MKWKKEKYYFYTNASPFLLEPFLLFNQVFEKWIITIKLTRTLVYAESMQLLPHWKETQKQMMKLKLDDEFPNNHESTFCISNVFLGFSTSVKKLSNYDEMKLCISNSSTLRFVFPTVRPKNFCFPNFYFYMKSLRSYKWNYSVDSTWAAI